MSIFKALKRTFGFSGTDDEDDYTGEFNNDDAGSYRDATVVPLKELHPTADNSENSVEHSENTIMSNEPETESKTDTEGSKVMEIFDGVIAIFNEAQPQFIRDCLDRDAQRRYLYNSLDSSIKTYLNHLTERARKEALLANEAERRQLQADIEALRQREAQAEQAKAEQQNKQLSAQRQQRALNQRVKDLESQVANLEAEREQYQLETKSLLNKLKVAEVKDGDLNAQREEIDELKRVVSAKNAENSKLSMMLAQREEELAKARKEIENIPTGEISENDRKMIMELTSQLDKFEDIKKAKDEKIARQAKIIAAKDTELSAMSASTAIYTNRIAELEKLTEEQQGTIAAMRERDALALSLQERNERSETTTPAPPVPESEPRRKTRRRKSKPAVSAIDETLDSVDWLLTAPTPENPGKAGVLAPAPDPDFGYQPPLKKDMSDNDAQLSLF